MKTSAMDNYNTNLLNRAVLVLNANYAPMAICTAKRAIVMGFLKKVEILANYNEKVHSPSTTLNLPSVIKIHQYISYDNLIEFEDQYDQQTDNKEIINKVKSITNDWNDESFSSW